MSKPSPPFGSTRLSAPQSSSSGSYTVPSSELSLDGVPDLYIISQLHRFAGNYWNKPETADCTIVVPKDVTALYQNPDDHKSVQANPLASGGSTVSEVQTDRPRRSKQQNVLPKLVFKLHRQYLSVQSTLLRSVLQSVQSQSSSPNQINDGTTNCASSNSSIRPPYILPSSRHNHPIIYLPIPDPVSMPHLVYYLYFGTFNHIEDSLQKGSISWQSIVRNVEYLGMRVEIKAALGRYHRIWMKPIATPAIPSSEQEKDDSSDSEDALSRSDTESPSGKDKKKV